MGLGFGYGQKGTAIFGRAVEEGLMDAPIFTVIYRKCPPGVRDCKDGGVITFGRIHSPLVVGYLLGEHDKARCGPVLGWAPVNVRIL